MIATGAVASVLVPDSNAPLIETADDGTEWFVAATRQDDWLQLGIGAMFVLYPTIFFWLFRKKLRPDASAVDEGVVYLRDWRRANAMDFVAMLLRGLVLTVFVASIAVFVFAVLILFPYAEIHRVAIGQDAVQLESTYRSWVFPRADIKRVTSHRDEHRGRHQMVATESVHIELRDGRSFECERGAFPVGGQKEEQNAKFFRQLKKSLE